MERRGKRLKEAKTVAVGCDRLPIGAHGKEGVDCAGHDLRATGAPTGARRLKNLQIAIFVTVSKTVIRR
jgi:hypothetical protein